MIKGLTKTILLLKCNKDSVFEQAIFFIKENKGENKIDIIEEAYKIICETEKRNSKQSEWRNNKKINHFLKILIFGMGFAAGVLFSLLLK